MERVGECKTTDRDRVLTLRAACPRQFLECLLSREEPKALVVYSPYVDLVISPGPCAYNVPPSINSVGKYADSRFTNSLAKSFDPPSRKNLSRTFIFTKGFAISMNQVPGPGAYRIANGISGSGEYFLSKIPSTKGFGFAKGARNLSNCSSYSRLKTPGPGCYRTMSEFGYMENANKGFLKTASGFNKKKLMHTASKSMPKLHILNNN
eukprot:TRINITY_DN956_c0_g6_i1.p1 TRINITY_DN956_c0_g6~~TRINITY_DN956_c0_g6_i1.p1  ORF type:complete len:208 (-),score=16.42 TRINITY_DN956_c0_g6_i1:51-674(-)